MDNDALDDFEEVQTTDQIVETTSDDLMECPNNMNKFCLLCKYGSTASAPTDDSVNTKIKKLEKAIEASRNELGREQLITMVERLYIDYIRDSEGFEDDDDWERNTIEEHLFVHCANSSADRGESLLQGITQEMILAARHAFKHMYNKETGLPDPNMARQALAWTDRLIKADARNMLASQTRKRKTQTDGGSDF